MVDISDLKTFILEEHQIEVILDGLGCHHIKHKDGFFQCANPDGDNTTAICVYENDNLTTVDFTRDISHGRASADIISLVEFFQDASFPQAVKQICQWVGLDYYHDFEEDLPESLKIVKELLALQGGDDSKTDDEQPIKPIPEAILGYYHKRVNRLFENDCIPYNTQSTFEVGYDDQTNYITIPIRDELGALVGVKGRYLGEPSENNPKYTYLERCPKGKILYGLYKTMPYIKREGKVFVGEAEKSVMQMWGMGVQSCVATGGKTISKTQIEMLTRLCVDVVFLFDKDVQPTELTMLANRFVDGVAVYAVIDEKGILDEKESPSDNPEKFKILTSEYIRRIK